MLANLHCHQRSWVYGVVHVRGNKVRVLLSRDLLPQILSSQLKLVALRRRGDEFFGLGIEGVERGLLVDLLALCRRCSVLDPLPELTP